MEQLVVEEKTDLKNFFDLKEMVEVTPETRDVLLEKLKQEKEVLANLLRTKKQWYKAYCEKKLEYGKLKNSKSVEEREAYIMKTIQEIADRGLSSNFNGSESERSTIYNSLIKIIDHKSKHGEYPPNAYEDIQTIYKKLTSR